MVHLDADTVVVVDSRQRLEYVDVNRTQIRISRLIDCSVSFDNILSAWVAATAGTPTFNHSHRTYRNPGFGRVHDDMFDFFTAPVYATTHGVVLNDARAHQHAWVILIGGSVGEGAHDVGRLIVRQRALIEVRSFHQKHVGVICVARSTLMNVMSMRVPASVMTRVAHMSSATAARTCYMMASAARVSATGLASGRAGRTLLRAGRTSFPSGRLS